MKQVELSKTEKEDVLTEFFKSFVSGYDFEQFLKIYLEKIGLDEIEVTQKSKDGGVDLKALKKGFDELTDLDSVKYYIQAKRYNPKSTVAIESVRALRGILPDGYKGIFITTGKFSKKAHEFARKSESRALILIDGVTLIQSCIDKGLGFRSKPVFSSTDLNDLITIETKSEPISTGTDKDFKKEFIKKKITDNDIRARILRIPKTIVALIPVNQKSFMVRFAKDDILELNIDKSSTYFSGITNTYKKFGLLDDNKNRTPKDSYWYFNKLENLIEIET